MLIKLIKYDIRADYKKYAITAAAILLVSLAVRLADIKFGNLDNGSDWKLLLMVLIGGFMGLCLVALLLTIIFSAVRYQKKMFSDEGYLLNTIPVDPTLHIVSSLITTVIWVIAVAAVDFIALIISAGGMNFWRGFVTPLDFMWNYDNVFTAYSLGFLFAFPITMMITLIFTINFGYLFRSHRVLAGIGGYVLLGIASQILTLIVYAVLGKSNLNAATAKVIYDNSDYMTSSESYQTVIREMSKLASGTYTTTVIANVIFFAAILIISVYILKKKFNID